MISADAIRGYVDLMVLSLLEREPSYAYQLVQQIAAVSGSEYAIKQTTLYTAVKRLESGSLVESFPGESSAGKPRTYYRITAAGITYLQHKIGEWQDTKTLVDRFVEGPHR